MSTWTGMTAATGRALGDLDHIRQSIAKILTTQVGSRVMRRDFGSLVPDLIDQPLNAVTRQRVMAATVGAILRWEPRIVPQRIALSLPSGTQATLDVEITAVLRTEPGRGSSVTLSVPVMSVA